MPTAGKPLGRVDDQFTIEDVGSTLLEHLAKGLYQPEEVIREYVQNAVDAHRLWKTETGGLPDFPIHVEVRGEQLTVYDYGIGMDMADIKKVKSIAVSRKRDADVALTGHKGVGIWAGLSYFEKLTLFTTKKGVDREYRLTIHFKSIVDAISDERNIGEVLNPNYSIYMHEADEDEHYTIVTLERPTRSADWFTESGKVADAIRTICPCEIDPDFVFHDELLDWYDQHGMEIYPMMVDGAPVYRTFSSAVEHLKSEAITINDEPVAELWYAVSKKYQLPSAGGQLVGFRLVQNGFVIGGANPRSEPALNGYKKLGVSNSNYLNWHIGEIHIISDKLRPNLQRDQLEESEVTRQFTQRLRNFYERVEEEDRALSDRRNTLAKYRAREQELDALMGRQALAVLNDADRATWEDIQSELAADEEQARTRSTGKKVAHLKDPEIRNLRSKLLRDIGRMLTGMDAGEPNRQPHKLVGAPQQEPSTSTDVSDLNGGIAPSGATHGLSPIVWEFNEPRTPSVPEPAAFPAPAEHSAAAVRDASSDGEVREPAGVWPNFGGADDIIAETGDGDSVQLVSADIFLSLLEEVLEQALPGNEALQIAIINRLRRRIDAVMSDEQ